MTTVARPPVVSKIGSEADGPIAPLSITISSRSRFHHCQRPVEIDHETSEAIRDDDVDPVTAICFNCEFISLLPKTLTS